MSKASGPMGVTQWALLASLAMLWGCSFLLVEICLESLPVLTTAVARMLFGGVTLIVVALFMGHRIRPDARIVREFIVLGFLRAAFPITLIVWAQARIDSAVAGILNSTSVIFTIIIAHLLTDDDRLTPARTVGVAVAIVGVVLLIGPAALKGMGDDVIGQLAMLAATCSYGFAAVYGRRFRGTPHVVSAAGMLVAGTLLLLPFALWFEDMSRLEPTTRSLLGLAGLSVLCTALAFVVWFKLIQSAGPANTSMVTLLIPGVAVGLGYAVLEERLMPLDFVGLGFLLAGLAVTQLRRRSPV